jgi:hypothetical protein
LSWTPEDPNTQGPRGIGGWLGLLAFSLAASGAANIYAAVMMAVSWGSVAAEGATIPALLIGASVIETALVAVTLVLMFKKKILFRTMFMATFAFNVVATLAVLFAESAATGTKVPLDWASLISIGVNIAWTAYLFRSKRVKNTFPGAVKGQPPQHGN